MDLVSLALGTLGGVAGVRGLAHVREHRVAPAGLADLVNWAFMVDDGVVLQKDGSLLAGWGYHAPDLSPAPAAGHAAGAGRRMRPGRPPFRRRTSSPGRGLSSSGARKARASNGRGCSRR